MPDTQITVADVIAEFGSYYIDQGQNMQSLLMRPFFAFGTRDAFTNIPTTDTQLRYSDVQVGKILQPYQKAFTPKGSAVFKPVTVDLHPVKIDLKFEPSELIYSWLGFLASLSNNNDRKSWPFTRWVIEVYALQQVFEDLEVDAIYGGVLAAAQAGVAGNPAGIINGVRKLINAGITNGDIDPINTGAPAADAVDWVTQIEEFVKQVPKRYRNLPMELNVQEDLLIRYREGRAEKYNMNYAQVSDLDTVRSFSNIRLKGRTSMDASNKIWMTPKKNFVFPVRGFSNATGFQVESEDRNVKIWTDFHIGLGYLLGDMLFTNDQDVA